MSDYGSKLDCWREAVKVIGAPMETLKLAQELHAWLNADADEEPETVASVIPLRSPIEEILKRYDGGITKLAAELGISHQSFYAWKKIPAERVIDLERITGIPRHELRPDLYPSPHAMANEPLFSSYSWMK